MLNAANENLEEKYELESKGYDFNRTVQRVAQVMGMQPDEVTACGKSPQTVTARALLCFWAQRKLGITTVDIARRLSICQSAVSRLSRKGERIAIERGAKLVEKKSIKS